MSVRRLARAGLALVCLLVALPASAAVVDVTGATAQLGWAPASGPVAAYGVFISRNGGGFPAIPNQFVATPQVTLTGAAGDTLVVKVAAFDAGGTKGPESALSDTLRFVAVADPPPAPPPASGGSPALTLSTTGLDVRVVEGQNAAETLFTVRNSGSGTLTYLTANSDDWMVLSTRSGTATTETDTIYVSFATSGLAPGSYAGTITVFQPTPTYAERYIAVNLTVDPTPASASIALAPGALTATTLQGSNAGMQSFTVRNGGGGTLSYSVSDDASWLSVSPSSGSSTGEADTISVSFAASNLGPGTYAAAITVQGGPGVAPRTVPVSLTVRSQTPLLSVSTTSLSVQASTGANANGQSFTLRNLGDETLSYLTANSEDWIVLSARSGTLTGETDTIDVGFATSGLSAGTYTGVITVVQTGANYNEKYITVNLLVGNDPPIISLSPGTLQIEVEAGSNPALAGFLVSNAGGGRLDYTIESSASWLRPTTTSGTSSGESDAIGLDLATANLAPGGYAGLVTVRGGPGVTSRAVGVSLTVRARPPSITLSSSSLAAVAEKGQNAPLSAFAVRNGGGGSLDYSVSDNASWLSVSPQSGRSDGENDPITVSYLTSGLAPGSYQAVVTVAAAGTPARTVTVSLTITDGAPVLAVSQAALAVVGAAGQNAASQTLSIRNTGSGTLIYTVSADQSWLSVTPASGTSVGESDPLSVSFASAGLPSGLHTATLTVTAAGLAPKQIPVTLSLSSGQRARADLDGDGRSDALFRHADGTLAGFLMDGPSVRSSVTPASLYSFWGLEAAGDFDGDGKSFDLLWVQSFSGVTMVSQNDGGTQKALGNVGTVDTDWVISGVADFDADGKSDLLWLDPASGVLTLWLVDGLTVKRAEAVGTLVPGWKVAAAGDFDADGKADILLENASTQQRLLWIFDGLRVRLAFAPSVPADHVFRTAAAGDFDGDGRTDIVAAYDAFGFVSVLNGRGVGFTASNLGALALGSPRITTGDYDGDGKDDLVFLDPATGRVTMSLTQGSVFANPALVGILDPNWKLVGEKGTAQ